MYCDLSSFKSIEKFTTNFQKTNLPLHLLVNNGKLWRTVIVAIDTLSFHIIVQMYNITVFPYKVLNIFRNARSF